MILFNFSHNIWNQIVLILMIFGILSFDPSGAFRSEAWAEADNCVKWEEIRGWRNLGPRWAGDSIKTENSSLFTIYLIPSFKTGSRWELLILS